MNKFYRINRNSAIEREIYKLSEKLGDYAKVIEVVGLALKNRSDSKSLFRCIYGLFANFGSRTVILYELCMYNVQCTCLLYICNIRI